MGVVETQGEHGVTQDKLHEKIQDQHKDQQREGVQMFQKHKTTNVLET